MFRSKQRVLLAKKESVVGTDSVPVVGTDAMEARNLKIDYSGDLLERDILRSDLSQIQPVIGKRKTKISFETELKGSGSLGVAPAISDLFLACGYSEVVSAGSSVIYQPTSVNVSSITLYIYDVPDTGSAILHKVTGARGSCKISLEAGKFAAMAWSFEGVYNTPADVTPPSAATYESTLPPIVQASTFTLNGVTSLVAQKLDIDLGAELVERDDLNAATALKEIIIGKRKPSGTFNPEAVQASVYDFYSDWIAATARTMSTVVGSTAGNKCTITAPKVTIDNVSDADRSGILTRDIPIRFSVNSTDDELKFVFA